MAKKKTIDIKKFRHAVSVLAKAGVIGKTDARKAEPNWVRSVGPRGRRDTLAKIVRDYDDVLSRKLTPVTLSKDTTAKLKRQGFEVSKPKGKKEVVLIPHGADEKIIKRGDTFVRVNPNGIESIALPCEYHELQEYLQCLKKNRKLINAMKRNDEWFGFRFWGNQSKKYRDIGEMIHDLSKYNDIVKALKSGRGKDMSEQFAHLEIVKIHRSAPAWHGPQGRKPGHGSTAAQREAKSRYRKRVTANPMKDAAQKAKHAEEERKRRANMSPAKKAEYKRKAKARAKRSRGK